MSVRTIYRDIADLSASGVPVTGEAGLGYALSRRMDLPPLMFDRDEAEAMAIGLRFAQAYGDEALAYAAERAQAKLRSAMPRDLADRMRDLPAFVPKRAARSAARLVELTGRIERRDIVRLAYRDEYGHDTERDVWPLGLLCSAQAWSLVAWCTLREGFRSFRLDRIGDLRDTGATYPVQPGRRLEDFFTEMRAQYGLEAQDVDPER